MRGIALLLVCLFVYAAVTAQPTSSQLFQNLIPAHYSILDSASGDLNKDPYKDLLLILKSDGEELNGDTARPLLLLAGSSRGYTLLARNDSVVLCRYCGGIFGDPYQGITIKNGYFSIEHYGGSNWRWTRVITFKWDVNTGTFILHRDAGTEYHTSDPNKRKEILHNPADFKHLSFYQYSYNKGW